MVQRTLTPILAIGLCCACASAPRQPSVPHFPLVLLSDSVRALVGDTTRVWRADSVEIGPQLLSIPKIEKRSHSDLYPASNGGEASRVVVQFILGTEGNPEPASIQALSPFDANRAAAAMAAVREARFRPATIGGRPVRVIINLPFDFPRDW
jgi:TonB family protein